MKNIFRTCFCLALYFVLFACTSNEPQETPTVALASVIHPLPSATATIMDATAIHSTFVAASSWPPLTPLPTLGFNMTAPVVTSKPLTPSSTQLPDFAPTEIPGLLQSALTVETLSNFNGHRLQRISGWKYGFYDLEWLDTNHLMLYSFAGVTNAVTDTTVTGTYPAVFNLKSKQFWIPYLSKEVVDRRASFPWSAQLGVLIIPGPNNEVSLYDPDGILRKSYPGTLLGVSPSATKLLIDSDTWIDLRSGKTVDFAWDQTGRAAEYASHARPIWSLDEMRVYTCCYAYGDARTGASFVMPFDEVTIDGKKEEGYLLAFGGMWVLNDKYILPWGGHFEGPLVSIYLFDPAAKTFRNLNLVTGIPDGSLNGNQPYCNQPFAPNGGRYVWVDCIDGGYLIDLATFRSQAYPRFGRLYEDSVYATEDDIDWSADGKFVKISGNILSTATKELKPLPKDCSDCKWHPKDNVLLCMSNVDQKLLLLDARTISVLKETTLSTKFVMQDWSPDGKHFALLASDNNSLWKVDYPGLGNLEQLTQAMPELTRQMPKHNETLVKNVIWSPDDMALAFIGGANIYIIETDNKP